MQEGVEVRKNANTSRSQFDSGFGFGGSMFPSLFGGSGPFDDPFFTRPFGSMFEPSTFSSNNPANLQPIRSSRPKIEELDSAEEVEGVEKQENDATDAALRNRNPLVEHPEDQTDGMTDHGNISTDGRDMLHGTNHDKVEVNRQQSRSVSFQRVTYGGINGDYYTATTSRKTGNDGVTVEDSRQADRTTGQATYRISRGLYDKGHSVTRKLDSDGKVDTVQTLHNLNEDELAGFEQAWRSNGERLSHGWHDTFEFPENSGDMRHGRVASWGGWIEPFREHSDNNRDPRVQSSTGKSSKKVVTINIE
ncbi:hypothetical protein OROGR_031980 [Orobanche gracilis]